jgi:hypothetical protein
MYGTERNELLDGFIKSRSLTVSRMKAIINNWSVTKELFSVMLKPADGEILM